MAASPSTCTALQASSWTNTSAGGRPTHPQNMLIWEQAKAVCAWTSARLPSESEWEYAATGPTHREYPWGHTPEPTCANSTAVFDEQGDLAPPWGCPPCSTSQCVGTSPVGERTAGVSWSGALDMPGNVFEWLEDWGVDSYSGAPTDGSPWMASGGTERVRRGGAYLYSAIHLRSSARSWLVPTLVGPDNGVRCVRGLP